ncbi:MAG TPA: rhombosortase [Marinagarivorans sp.]
MNAWLSALVPAQPLYKHVVFALFCVLVLALGFLPETAVNYLELRTSSGLSYRWFSAHYVHLGGLHAAMNVAGICVLWLLVVAYLPLRLLAILLLVLPFSISAGLFVSVAESSSYRGFSGALYGFFAAGIIWHWWLSRGFCILLGAFLLGKIVMEQLPGFDNTYLLSSIGGLVAVDSHLFGAISGSIVASVYLICAKLGLLGCNAPWSQSEPIQAKQ